LLVLGLLMSTMIPSSTIPHLTLTRLATIATLNQLMHFLTATTIAANTIKCMKKCVVASTLTFSSLQTCAAHAMEVRL
jgi:hypothetical protein